MLLTVTNTNPPATDLGYLLHKNPARWQSFELPFGKAMYFIRRWALSAARLPCCSISILRDWCATDGGQATSLALWISKSTIALTSQGIRGTRRSQRGSPRMGQAS